MKHKKTKAPHGVVSQVIVLRRGIETARIEAIQAINALSSRKLASYHANHAATKLSALDSLLQDYENADSRFSSVEARAIDDAVTEILTHLQNVRAIALQDSEGGVS